MSGCGNCGGCGKASGCSGCSGCGGGATLELTGDEIAFLRLLGQVAFLPVARKEADATPVCLEDGSGAQSSLLLQCLEKKMLISLDYEKPLRGAAMERYGDYPIHGSIALTRRGQQVLELLDIQGYAE